VLVAFATKHRSTGEIARTIGAGLAEVDVLLVEQLERIDNYRAVVVGSGVYMNRWLKPGTDFLKRFRRTLAARPIRLLSSGHRDADRSVEAAAASVSTPPAPKGVGKWLDRLSARGHMTSPGRIGDDFGLRADD
jgi:menaquinone-dependent protoporphyrinogen oxidase